MVNTIVSGNAGVILGSDTYGTFTAYNSLITSLGSDNTTTFTPNSASNITGESANFASTSGDNAYRLAGDSGAIDAGSNSLYPVGNTDLAGNQRIWNGTVDMGAYEYDSQPPVVLTPADLDFTITGPEDAEVLRGNTVDVSWSISNNGDEDADYIITYYLSSTARSTEDSDWAEWFASANVIGSATGNSANVANSSTNLMIPGDTDVELLIGQTYYIIGVMTYDGSTALDVENLEVLVTREATPANVEVSDVFVTEEFVYVGGTINAGATVSNNGELDSDDSWTYNVYYEDSQGNKTYVYKNVTSPVIEANGSQNFTEALSLPGALVPGNYTFVVEVWNGGQMVSSGSDTFSIYETPAIVVTTLEDIVDPTDGKISLREAIEVYAYWGELEGDITFADGLVDAFGGTTILMTDGIFSISGDLISIDASNYTGDNMIWIDAGDQSGIFNLNGESLTLTGLGFTGGNATNGGVIDASDATLIITDCVFEGNTATYGGGAIRTVDSTVTIDRSQFIDNIAGDNGGALGLFTGNATITNSLFAGNSSAASGGAIDVTFMGGSLTLKNVTIADNSAAMGGGGISISDFLGGAVVEVYNSIITDNGTGNSIAGGDIVGGINLIDGNAGFVDAANGDYSLQPTSQAVNAGVDADAYGDKDVIGNNRYIGSKVDLGAYELQQVVYALEATDDSFEIDLADAASEYITGYNHAFEIDLAKLLGDDLIDGNTFAYTIGMLNLDSDGQVIFVGNKLYYVLEEAPQFGTTYSFTYSFTYDGFTSNEATAEFTFVYGGEFIVTTTEDQNASMAEADGFNFTLDNLSLREAIWLTDALAAVSDEVYVITFDGNIDGETIDLVHGEMTIKNSVTISAATLEDGITIDANGQSRIFNIGQRNTPVNPEEAEVFGADITVTLLGLHLTDASMLDGFGGAITAANTALTLDNMLVDYSKAKVGGGIYQIGGSLDIVNSTFNENNALGATGSDGGGVYFTKGDLSVSENSAFTNNTSLRYGGAIYVSYSTTEFTDTTFELNKAKYGGGVYNSHGGLTIGEGVKFNENTATYRGGALYANANVSTEEKYDVIIQGTSESKVEFNNNSAANNGGAIMIISAKDAIVENTSFDNNVSGANGGAIYMYNGNLKVQKGTSFFQNTATNNGGAISAENGANVTVNGTTEAIVTFEKNESLTGYGGAIDVQNATATVSVTNAKFDTNKALSETSRGGAINLFRSDLDLVSSEFKSNSAASGGAVFGSYSNVDVDNTVFTSNKVADSGGAVYVTRGSLSIYNNSSFKSNRSSTYGGAVYTSYSDVDITATSFESNISHYGGGIYNSAGVLTLNAGTRFESNTATNRGGAVYFTSSSALTVTGTADKPVEFIDNYAGNSGGALFLQGGGIGTMTGYRFAGNDSFNGEGIAKMSNFELTLVDGDNTKTFEQGLLKYLNEPQDDWWNL